MISNHMNEKGDAHMVDVGDKKITTRIASAASTIILGEVLIAKLKQNAEVKKGNLFSVCVLAGIMAAKKTSDLIPLCHPLPLTKVELDYSLSANAITFISTVKTEWVTGVEMEAMVAASTAALTCYDMLKSENKGITLSETKLLIKTGGKSGDWHAHV